MATKTVIPNINKDIVYGKGTIFAYFKFSSNNFVDDIFTQFI